MSLRALPVRLVQGVQQGLFFPLCARYGTAALLQVEEVKLHIPSHVSWAAVTEVIRPVQLMGISSWSPSAPRSCADEKCSAFLK